MTLFKQF